jgi:uncharacterized membrane protein (UPF0127 family)
MIEDSMIRGDIQTVMAHTWRSRLKGLLGSRREEWQGRQLLIVPCKAVHTFWMTYPIDVAFLDGEGTVEVVKMGVAPRRIKIGSRGAYAVLERPASNKPWYQEGDSAISGLQGRDKPDARHYSRIENQKIDSIVSAAQPSIESIIGR